jgi:hypothetical protein
LNSFIFELKKENVVRGLYDFCAELGHVGQQRIDLGNSFDLSQCQSR